VIAQILYASSVHPIPTSHSTIVGLVSTGGKDMHYLMFQNFFFLVVAPFNESNPNVWIWGFMKIFHVKRPPPLPHY